MTATVAPALAGDRHYLHTQGVPAATWTVVHNLGKEPAVDAVDSSGRQVYGHVTHLSQNALTIDFSVPFGGTATCN